MVWNLIDINLIQGVDATDNGTMPKTDYPAQAMSFSQTISEFNPAWDSSENSDDAFLKAVNFAEVVFDNVFANAIFKAKAQQIVDDAIEKSEGHIMILDRFVHWQEFIFSSTNEKAEGILFVVFHSNRESLFLLNGKVFVMLIFRKLLVLQLQTFAILQVFLVVLILLRMHSPLQRRL